MKKEVKMVERKLFLKIRYENFLLKQLQLDAVDPDRQLFHLTDLDEPKFSVNGKLLRDIILCDRCNSDIEELFFIMIDENFCYHEKCCPISDRNKLKTANNVVKLM